MDQSDILSIPARREVVREIIEGTRTKHLYESRLNLGAFVEFFSAPPLQHHDFVESFPENDALRVIVRLTNLTEGFLGKYFFHWNSAVAIEGIGRAKTIDEERHAVLDAVRRFSEGMESLVPAFPVSKVTGIPLQVVEDHFELLAREDHLLYRRDTSGHYAVLRPSGRQYLRQFDLTAINKRTTETTALPVLVHPIHLSVDSIRSGSEETIPRKNADDRTNFGCGSEYQVVLLIHGIRTQADWGPMVKSKLEIPGQIEVIPIKYGYFDALSFWFTFWTRNKPIERVYTQIRVALQKARRSHPDAKLSIVAHSFGTYIIGQIIQRGFDLQIHRLILCGSVLPQNFPWEQYQGRFDDNNTINECGKSDIWPVLAKSLSWGYGDSGTNGFGGASIKDRYHAGGHGQYFDPKFVEASWEPFIKRGEFEGSKFEVQMPPTPWWLSVLGILQLKWLIVPALLVGASWACYIATNSFKRHVPPSDQVASPPPKSVLTSDIDISSASFIDYNSDAIAPRLDLKITNMGSHPAFITRVIINVKRSWKLKDLPEVPGVVVPPGHNYLVKLKSSDRSYRTEINTSEGIKHDDFGRFSLQFEEDPWAESNTIYLANVELVANGDESNYKTKDLIFLITQQGGLFPSSKRLNELIAATKSLGQNVNTSLIDQALSENKRIISEVEKIDAVKNPALLKLIESAKVSRLGLP